MRILIVTAAPPGSRLGNGVSARRWTRLLRAQGHRVALARAFAGQRCDLLVALHAVASHRSIVRFRRERPAAPLVLALTGTDLYRDLRRRKTRARVLRSMQLADRIVTLNLDALRRVPPPFRRKVRCIVQGAPAGKKRRTPERRGVAFRVCVIGHLRSEKDPLRVAYAARRLPAGSRIRVEQAGRALHAGWARRAEAEMRRNPRYRWLGELTASQVRRLMARADVLVHPSRMEGGANTVGEAVRAGLPVLASRVAGNVGLLGRGYPGYFPAGQERILARLLLRAERDPTFLNALRTSGRALAPRFAPAREAQGWRKVIAELSRSL